MHLGIGLDTASGVSHEVDIVARTEDLIAILEAKNRQGLLPDKNDVVVFFAKVLDYVAINATLVLKSICPTFMSSTSFEDSGLAACLGLGIHPVAPGLRPLPLLIHNAKCMDYELKGGSTPGPEVVGQFDDFCAQLNHISSVLNDTWMSSRCGYVSETKVLLNAVPRLDTLELAQQFRQLNGDCTHLMESFKSAKSKDMR